MAKRVSRPRRPGGRSGAPARRDPPAARGLLERILDTPHLDQVVPRLPADLLHRVIQHCGLEDCGEIVALATSSQLAQVFDLDLWKSADAGLDEQFDPDRFGLWLEVMMESGSSVAAQTLTRVDVALAIAAFAHHVRVFDPAAISLAALSDGDELPDVRTAHDGPTCEVGGYLVVGRRTNSWDAVVNVLSALGEQHGGYFHRLMSGCRRLSNSRPEVDGLDDLLPDQEQTLFDLAFTRERRREQQGYMTPAQARAFLQMSRHVSRPRGTPPPPNPIARAYFRAIDWTAAADVDDRDARALPPGPDALSKAQESEAIGAFVDVLRDAGVLPPPPRALLDGAEGPVPRLTRIQALMRLAGERDQFALSARSQELAFLANTLAAGCSIQARAFTAREASDAVVATCNLGLENWTSSAALADDFLVAQDLVSVFQVGWTVLHEKVCMHAAEQLIAILRRLRVEDRETQAGLNVLRLELTKHFRAGVPWRARDAFDVLAILDMPVWAAQLGLIDECPVMHAGIGVRPESGIHRISATDFAFVSENSQIASIHAFIRSLPETLAKK